MIMHSICLNADGMLKVHEKQYHHANVWGYHCDLH